MSKPKGVERSGRIRLRVKLSFFERKLEFRNDGVTIEMISTLVYASLIPEISANISY